jgi:hypothetical protein
MSVYDIPKEAQIVALSPPVFHAVCVQCGLWRRVLAWQFPTGDDISWGPICEHCAKPLLKELLQARLSSSFSKTQFLEVLFGIGACRKESELLFSTFQKEGSIEKDSSGFCWSTEVGKGQP